MEKAYMTTPLGTAVLCGDHRGIASISIVDTAQHSSLSSPIPDSLKTAVYQLQEYFEGKRKVFELCLHPKGTDFQKKVWHALCNIPYGETVSYIEIAKILGNPKVIRAAASANAKNPLWIVIPCHRVIGSDGSLTGYAGGLWRKQWLLDHEQPIKQYSLF